MNIKIQQMEIKIATAKKKIGNLEKDIQDTMDSYAKLVGAEQGKLITKKRLLVADKKINSVVESKIVNLEVKRDDKVKAINKKISDLTDEITEAEAKKTLLAEADKVVQDGGNLEVYFQEMLQEFPFHYVLSTDLYYLYNEVDGKWDFIKPKAMAERFVALREKAPKSLFTDTMEANDRLFTDVKLTYKKVGKNTLNLLTRDHWLKPVPGEHHAGFDILLWSLAGGKQENFDHLEHVVWRKYSHPEDFLIPCISIFGQGGVGKDLFVQGLCRQIFGRHHATVIDADELTGFNDLIMGKAIVYINEAVNDKANMSTLKKIIGSETITVNVKYGPKLEPDNTALYLMGTNDPLSAIQLAKDGSDRRWSIIKTEKTLLEHINEKCELGIEYNDPQDLVNNKIITKVLDNIADEVFKNPVEIGKWLNYLQEKWGKKGRPAALHGADYDALCNVQKKTEEHLFDAVFMVDGFKFISGKALYNKYKDELEASQVRVQGGFARGKFDALVANYLKKHKLDIHYDASVDTVTNGGYHSTSSGWVVKNLTGRVFVFNNTEDELVRKAAEYDKIMKNSKEESENRKKTAVTEENHGGIISM